MQPTDMDLSPFNPFFPGSMAHPRLMAPTLLAIFDNSTLYTPGSLIMTDHQLTVSGHEYHKQLYLENFAPIPRSVARDYKGLPYVWPADKKEL